MPSGNYFINILNVGNGCFNKCGLGDYLGSFVFERNVVVVFRLFEDMDNGICYVCF
jgi:hypothetical protein